jgi:hypothetical protein
MGRDVLGAAASPAGWPPPERRAAARLRRAAALQNTTDSHSEFGIISLSFQAAPAPAGGWRRPQCPSSFRKLVTFSRVGGGRELLWG